jgi:hypothetical protein
MASKAVPTRVVVLVGLLIVLAAVLVAVWPAGSTDTQGSITNPPRAAGAPGDDPAVPQPLRLDAMESQRVEPANRRDLFRFGSARPEAIDEPVDEPVDPGDDAEVQPPDAAAEPDPQEGAPQAPPIPLRYVGYAETPGTGKVAALSDGRFMYHGREGDVIEGRWRIVSIGVESVVIERVDGTGRQALRLSGGEI